MMIPTEIYFAIFDLIRHSSDLTEKERRATYITIFSTCQLFRLLISKYWQIKVLTREKRIGVLLMEALQLGDAGAVGFALRVGALSLDSDNPRAFHKISSHFYNITTLTVRDHFWSNVCAESISSLRDLSSLTISGGKFDMSLDEVAFITCFRSIRLTEFELGPLPVEKPEFWAEVIYSPSLTHLTLTNGRSSIFLGTLASRISQQPSTNFYLHTFVYNPIDGLFMEVYPVILFLQTSCCQTLKKLRISLESHTDAAVTDDVNSIAPFREEHLPELQKLECSPSWVTSLIANRPLEEINWSFTRSALPNELVFLGNGSFLKVLHISLDTILSLPFGARQGLTFLQTLYIYYHQQPDGLPNPQGSLDEELLKLLSQLPFTKLVSLRRVWVVPNLLALIDSNSISYNLPLQRELIHTHFTPTTILNFSFSPGIEWVRSNIASIDWELYIPASKRYSVMSTLDFIVNHIDPLIRPHVVDFNGALEAVVATEKGWDSNRIRAWWP